MKEKEVARPRIMLTCLEPVKERQLTSSKTRHHLNTTMKTVISQMIVKYRHAMYGQVTSFAVLGAAAVSVGAGVCGIVAGVVLTRVTARAIESHAYMECGDASPPQFKMKTLVSLCQLAWPPANPVCLSWERGCRCHENGVTRTPCLR
jgi:hypothetical protein